MRETAPGSGRYSWILTYHSADKPPQQRRYEIAALDASRGHYEIDEKNGLRLRAFLVGDELYSPFSVGRSLIMAKYRLLARAIVVEMPSYSVRPVAKTCVTGNPSVCARSYALRSVQRCVLRRAK